METRHRFNPIILKYAREMRHPQTPAEATVWRCTRNQALGYKFRRQHPIERFILDFYCAELKLCIEIDGNSHFEEDQQEYDAARTEYLQLIGRKVIRFTNDTVRFNINAVIQEIKDSCERLRQEHNLRGIAPHPNPLPARERELE
jgi:very-short-patch-repair endonuclease